jgi:uridylate kinase
VDGVYDSDPKINPNAKKFDKIGYLDVVNKGLEVMDNTACTLCMENNIPILAFGITQKDGSNAIMRAIMGESIGTLIS